MGNNNLCFNFAVLDIKMRIESVCRTYNNRKIMNMTKPSPSQSPAQSSSLDELRQKIDATDAALLDLLQQRAALVAQIGALKAASQDPSILRPARETQQMRKLIDWHKSVRSPMPLMGFLAIWREIIASAVSQQQALQVFFVPDDVADKSRAENDASLLALARAQFGYAANYQPCVDAKTALASLAKAQNNVAVLPLHGDWWANLPDGVHVFAALPLLANHPQALCVGKIILKESGDDITLICGAENALPQGAQLIAKAGNQCLAQLAGFWPQDKLPAPIKRVGVYGRIIV